MNLNDIQFELSILRKHHAFNNAWLFRDRNNEISLSINGEVKLVNENTFAELLALKREKGLIDFPGYENNEAFQRCLNVVRNGSGSIINKCFRFVDAHLYFYEFDRGTVESDTIRDLVESPYERNSLQYCFHTQYKNCVQKYLPMFFPYHKSDATTPFIFDDGYTKLSYENLGQCNYIGVISCTDKEFDIELKSAASRIFSKHGFKFNDWDNIEVENEIVSTLALNGYMAPQINDGIISFGDFETFDYNQDLALNGCSDLCNLGLFSKIPASTTKINDFYL